MTTRIRVVAGVYPDVGNHPKLVAMHWDEKNGDDLSLQEAIDNQFDCETNWRVIEDEIPTAEFEIYWEAAQKAMAMESNPTSVLRDDLEILQAEPTAEDIAATNAGLAAYAARQCSIKVGDVVVYHRWDKTSEGKVFKVEILCTVTKVMPVFNSYIRNSFRVTATCPPESKMEALEADESFFTRIEEKLAQCS